MHNRFTPLRNTAFSLVELSIVLVILGLLTGGILAGRSLIRASELRSVSTDLSRFQAAVFSFRDKYFGLPGDITNATSFWGSAGGNGSNDACFLSAGGTKATCNGDGNGQIGWIIDNGTTFTYNSEGLRAWQQLADAGLIEGAYNGVAGGAGSVDFGTNAPRSKMNNGGFGLGYADDTLGVFNPGQKANSLFFGAADADTARGPILKPEEAWNTDNKMDDGNPTVGKIIVDPNQTTCFTGVSPATTYTLSNSSLDCSLRLILK